MIHLTKEPSCDPIKGNRRKFPEGCTGCTYEWLFADYLKGATEVTLIDPHLSKTHQRQNLISFIELFETVNKGSGKVLSFKLITTPEDENEGKAYFDKIENYLSNEKVIKFSYKFQRDIHDRFIETDSGWEIALGRGLDIYERGDTDFERYVPRRRKTRRFFIDARKTEE